MSHRFETLDVFTDRRFGGNPLAVFPDAEGLDETEMQALAAEFNLSETTFVLPPRDSANTARMRIFNRQYEMPFAGHPSIGTAWLLARHGRATDGVVRLEVPAGLVRVEIARDANGQPSGARLTAPQPLQAGEHIDPESVTACMGLELGDIVTTRHPPIAVSVGIDFVVAELAPDALDRCVPDLAAFRAALKPWMRGRLSLFAYARSGNDIRARMFAPLSGTFEDPATGSASAALGAYLLSIDGGAEARFTIRQGVEMGRPSLLVAEAERTPDGIVAHVAGNCVPILRGELVR